MKVKRNLTAKWCLPKCRILHFFMHKNLEWHKNCETGPVKVITTVKKKFIYSLVFNSGMLWHGHMGVYRELYFLYALMDVEQYVILEKCLKITDFMVTRTEFLSTHVVPVHCRIKLGNDTCTCMMIPVTGSAHYNNVIKRRALSGAWGRPHVNHRDGQQVRCGEESGAAQTPAHWHGRVCYGKNNPHIYIYF